MNYACFIRNWLNFYSTCFIRNEVISSSKWFLLSFIERWYFCEKCATVLTFSVPIQSGHTSWWLLLGMYIYYTPISSQGRPIFRIQFDFFRHLSKMWAEQPFTFNAISPLHSPSVGIPAVIWVGITSQSCLISVFKPFSLFVFFRLILFLLTEPWQNGCVDRAMVDNICYMSAKFDAKFDECLRGLLLFYVQNVNSPEPPGPGTMPLSRQEVAVSNRARGASNDARAAADDYNVALDVALGSGRGGARWTVTLNPHDTRKLYANRPGSNHCIAASAGRGPGRFTDKVICREYPWHIP